MTHTLRIPMRTPCLSVSEEWYWDKHERAETMALCKDLFHCPDNDHVCRAKAVHIYEHVVAAHQASVRAKDSQPERLCAYFMLDPRCVRDMKRCPTAAGYRALFSAMKQRSAALHSIDRLPFEILLHEIYPRLNISGQRACRVVWRQLAKRTPPLKKDPLDLVSRFQNAWGLYYSGHCHQFLQWAHDDCLTALSAKFWSAAGSPTRAQAGVALIMAAMGGAANTYTTFLETPAEEAHAQHTALCAGQFAFVERVFGRLWQAPFWDRIFENGYAPPPNIRTLYSMPVLDEWIRARNEFALGKWADEIVKRRLHVGYRCVPDERGLVRQPDVTAADASPAIRSSLLKCAEECIVPVLERFKEGTTWTSDTIKQILRHNCLRSLDWFYTHKRDIIQANACVHAGVSTLPIIEWFYTKGLLDVDAHFDWLWARSEHSRDLRRWLLRVSPRALEKMYGKGTPWGQAEAMVGEWTAFEGW
jgi:hypothetical protein